MKSGWSIIEKSFRAAQQASQLERRADEAERETIKMKKVEHEGFRIGNEGGALSPHMNYVRMWNCRNTVEAHGACHKCCVEITFSN